MKIHCATLPWQALTSKSNVEKEMADGKENKIIDDRQTAAQSIVWTAEKNIL